jgi:DNA-3-methyladenine glycosylase I
MKKITKCRCAWVSNDPLYIEYHDTEWGIAVYDDRLLFELLVLEGMQAGLSWFTILKRRENYRQLFDNFDAKKIIKYQQKKIDALLANPGIIRNKLKVNSIVINAKLFLMLQKKYGSFAKYIWKFVGGKPIQNLRKDISQVPATTEISDDMSKELKKLGFKFVGSTICYAYMQAVGMVNDHTQDCFRYGKK